MKKKFTLFNLIAVLGLCTMFTSCTDDDTEEAMVLSGQWRGDWGMYYEIEHLGLIYTFDSYDTDIVFYPDHDYATHGYGYQVDWYREGPYERMSYRFNWSINNGVVYLTYPGYPEYNTSIRDYRMNNDRFTGYFSNGTQPFYLYKIADYYNWSYYYDYDYHYWYYDDWSWDYYAKTRGAAAEGDSVKGSTKEDRIVKIGSRLAE
ncbi:MAG: hypothetical protein IJ693_11075 [Bacteroidaceae bacterium]|nr:hypothetical protein [Bacteroidaceae bacterium]